nr:alanine--tRNA ligase [Bacilli bacterium]
LDVKEYANNLKEEAKALDKKVSNLKKEENKLDINSFNKDFEDINGANVLIKKIENVDVNTVKDLVDALAEQKDNSICVFAIVNDGRIIFVCKNKVKALKAGMIVKQLAVATGGNGGGRDDFAQAGGKDVSKLDAAFEEIKETIKDACK